MFEGFEHIRQEYCELSTRNEVPKGFEGRTLPAYITLPNAFGRTEVNKGLHPIIRELVNPTCGGPMGRRHAQYLTHTYATKDKLPGSLPELYHKGAACEP